MLDVLSSDAEAGEKVHQTGPSLLAIVEKSGRLEGRFAAQARRAPDRIALIHRGRSWSYRELDERANRLAHHLAQHGAGPTVLVGIYLDRTADLVATLLAVLKTGAAYVPLDPAYPAERLSFMLADSAAAVVVKRGRTPAGIGTVPAIDLDDDAAAIARCPAEPSPVAGSGPDDLACVIYTSGSTGRPKGVMLRHTATAMIDWTEAALLPSERERVAATTSVCFDPSVLEIFVTLALGGTVLLKDSLLELFDDADRPTLLNGVPSAVAELARAGRIPSSVRAIQVGGEVLSATLVGQIYDAAPSIRLFNHYGPTEATITATVQEVFRFIGGDPPIGRPIAGSVTHVLDGRGRPIAPGEVGELFIGGPNLAVGYLGQPDLSAERFIVDPFTPDGRGRLYRTGDLVRTDAAGALHFVGRATRQVKFRGHRIELDEVELAFSQIPAVRGAAVIARSENGLVRQITAFVSADGDLDLASTRRALGDTLPRFMLPTELIVLSSLPLTPSGKVDRAALTAIPPAPPAQGANTDHLPPIEDTVLHVFRDVLGRPSLGPGDDFFDHGGDSLLAFAAVSRLGVLLGFEMPVDALYHRPTPNGFALLIADNGTVAAGHLVTLSAGGDGAPLFCLPDLYGRPLSMLALAKCFEGERPVLGLVPGPAEAEQIASPSAVARPRLYAAAVRAAAPTGPCFLVGYSAGGPPAIDLAASLRDEGRDVRLVLIDPYSRRVRTGLKRRLRRLLLATLGGRWTLPDRPQRPLIMENLPSWIPSGYRPIAHALAQGQDEHALRPFGGPTLLIQRRNGRSLRERLQHLDLIGWRPLLSGPTDVVPTTIGHWALMHHPDASTVADQIRRFVMG